uniref:Jacalin-related lectin 16 n=1 Tax=Noccaea caerulescens TaxID=107243 RepID=A0A1J3E138_NOCCA
MGYEDDCTKFTLGVEGKKISGFHGSAAYYLFGLGAYFDWIPSTRMEAKGGDGGKEWDDKSDHDAISKIQVQGGTQGIQFIKFDYIKDGQPKDGPVHGFSDEGVTFTGSFEINYLEKEYLVSIEGFYDEDSNVIQGLQFKTNMNTSDMMGYDDGKRFLLATNGKKIIGFHGYADKHLNSLGAYFITLPPIKLESQGRRDGCIWDDGAFEGVKKVYVHYEKSLINYIGFDYDNGGGKVKKSMHGARVRFVDMMESLW